MNGLRKAAAGTVAAKRKISHVSAVRASASAQDHIFGIADGDNLHP
jgi:hypothetical protein